MTAISPFYYHKSISDFLREDVSAIFSALEIADDHAEIKATQRDVWSDEVLILKKELSGLKGDIIFEYSIPRLGKRIDVVVLIKGVIFILEFKGGDTKINRSAREQVWDYALDLKYFHEASSAAPIVPMLIPFGVSRSELVVERSKYHDQVYEPLILKKNEIASAVRKFLEKEHSACPLNGFAWAKSRYSPTPTIIQAATELYRGHNVKSITRNGATGKSLERTTRAVLKVIRDAKKKNEKCICFVTGVPGAGKTLIGLNVAIQQNAIAKNISGEKAVYLSGNQPLVEVLSEALARDQYNREIVLKKKSFEKVDRKTGGKPRKKGYTLAEARIAVHSFIQIVHHYRKVMLSKIKRPFGAVLEIDARNCVKSEKDGYAEVDRIAIFDEAQRAWTCNELARWLKRKKRLTGFKWSEPEFLIWSMDQHPGWAVIICLVGGGQEINRGEAGISEWIKAINMSFPKWKVYVPAELSKKDFSDKEAKSELAACKAKKLLPNLHLTATMRSFRAKKLSVFVDALLNLDTKRAIKIFKEIRAQKYEIVLTRDIKKAKDWLCQHARGSERFGLMASSRALRLRPLAVDVKHKASVVHWFLDDIKDIRSSVFLEDVTTEFDVQGLELDWGGVIWDGDLIYDNNGWKQRNFKGNTWQRNSDDWNRRYQINAYRVLLTRARQGVVICVPKGDDNDPTRKPAFYDSTYEYLKSLGLEEI